MKKLLIIFSFILIVLNIQAQEVAFNENGALELKQVVIVENATKDAIFTNVRSIISDALPISNNSESAIDYSDIGSGVIIAKGLFYLGDAKGNFGCKWHIYDNYTMTVKVKDGKYQISIKVPSITLVYSGDKTKTTVNTKQIYPEYDGSKLPPYVKVKQAVIEYGPKIPDSMRILAKNLNEKISKVEDDF